MIQVRQQAQASARAGRGRPLTVTAQPGDLLLLAMSSQWSHVGSSSVPAGWQHVYSDGAGSAGRSGLIAWTRAASAGPVLLEQWWSISASYGARQNGVLLALSGVEPGVEPVTTGWSTTAPGQVGPGLLLAQEHGSRWAPLNEFTLSNGKVVVRGTASKRASWSTIRAVLAPEAATVTPGQDRATTVWAAVELRPASSQSTVNLAVARGQEQVEELGQVSPTPHEPVSVETLLASQAPWRIAHRGGSADWPEMSLRAYTEAAKRGVAALELSFSLTSDGVAVGLHDTTLVRVDPSAPPTPLTQMTWQEVQAFKSQGEPFIRLETLLTAYGDSHVLFIDPKQSASSHAQYLPLLDPQRTVLKYYGNATWLAQIWRAQGFRTWGYLYSQEILDGRAATWAPYWDLIGVPWYASQKVWQIAKSYGKPIIGHVCHTQEAVDICLEMGASAVMCAKVDGTTTR